MDDGEEAEPTGLPGPAARPVLDGLRLTLFEALSSKRPVLGQMYLGALAALDRGDPESLAQGAHSMRVLLEKLPTYVEGIPQERRSPSLTEAARNLATSFNQAKDTSGCWTDDDWRGEIDASLRKLLRNGLPSFLAVAAAMKPPRRTERAELLRRVDDGPLPMPAVVEELRIAEWEVYSGFFQGVSHHTRETSTEEVANMMRRCEQFLLDRLVPRTFENRAAIAAIIAEVEHGK